MELVFPQVIYYLEQINEALGTSLRKIWNASRICVSSLRRGHANLLCIVPILIYVQPKLVRYWTLLRSTIPATQTVTISNVYGAAAHCARWIRSSALLTQQRSHRQNILLAKSRECFQRITDPYFCAANGHNVTCLRCHVLPAYSLE